MIDIIIRIIRREDLKFSGRNELILSVLKVFSGPYFSCHNLSLYWKIFIKGDRKIVGITDKMWVNHSEIEGNPSLINVFLLNWNIRPKRIPVDKKIKI